MPQENGDRRSGGDRLNDVLDKLNELAQKASISDYIYRGETECHSRVSSRLYRRYSDYDEGDIDIANVQQEMLQAAKQFTGQADDDDLLAHLQHYGCWTNLIDFTTDYNIAFFFACEGQPEEDGRVILLNRAAHPLREPRNPANRVIAQKSIFVEPRQGFVEPSDIVLVPRYLKGPILEHLRIGHGVSAASIYNDLHGFIKYQNTHQSAYAEFYVGVTHDRKDDNETALQHYSSSIALNPRMAVTYSNRGIVYTREGEYDLAVRDLDRVIELAPHFANAYCGRGIAHLCRGDLDYAIQDLERAVELDPKSAIAHSNRGIAYADKGELDLAIKDLDRALELDPNSANAYVNRGNAYRRRGQVELAMQDYDRAVQLAPNSGDAYTNRSTAHLGKQDYDRAIEDNNKAIELAPTNPHAYNNRGVAYWEKGDLTRALEDYNEALALDPKMALAYFNRGEYWLSVEGWEQARSDLSIVQDLQVDVALEFSRSFDCVADFEEKYGVKLPASLAAILTRQP